jgi:hypothetical protein
MSITHPAVTGTTLTDVPVQPQAAPSAAGASAITLVVLVVGFLLWRLVEKKKAKTPHLLMAAAFGVLISGSLFGALTVQMSASLGASLSTMLTSFTQTTGTAPR